MGDSNMGGVFRGMATVLRTTMPAVRTIGGARPLAFASEGAVAGKSLIPKSLYYGCWGLSGVAIAADITTRVVDAPDEKKLNTGLYHAAFHVPASLVVPAVIIHHVVHDGEGGENHQPAVQGEACGAGGGRAAGYYPSRARRRCRRGDVDGADPRCLPRSGFPPPSR